MGILGCLAVPVEWDFRWQQAWRMAYEKSRSSASELLARDLDLRTTALIVLKVKPAMADAVVAVTPYDSLDDLKQELGIQKRQLTGADGTLLQV